MSKKQIKYILDDLYKIDESLKESAPQLEKIIAEIIGARPDIKIDENFKKELYKQLILKAEKSEPIKTKKIGIWQYTFAGALVAIVVLVIVSYLFISVKPEDLRPEISDTELKFSKTVVGENAFGSLIGDQSSQETVAPVGRGGGVGGGGVALGGMPDQTVICAEEEGCIIPPYYFFEYTYVGEDINLEQTKIEVLKRKNRIEPLGILKSFGFSLIDLSAFDDAKIQTVNFVQDKPYGYTVFVNFDEGTISIDSYWPKWPQPYNKCRDDKCYESLRLKLSDVPVEEELITIADKFIAEHKINLRNYGQPEMDNDWKNQPGIFEEQLYVPDYISLVYPLLIDGKFVYEQSGTKYGIRISINIREKRVSGIYNLSLQEYESSMYAGETDFSRILEVARRGGLNMYYWGEGGQSKQVEIETPNQEYMAVWRYNQNMQLSEMLIVPALVFPVVNAPTDGYYYQNKIIVPLAKELLEQNQSGPYPVPLLEKAQ